MKHLSLLVPARRCPHCLRFDRLGPRRVHRHAPAQRVAQHGLQRLRQLAAEARNQGGVGRPAETAVACIGEATQWSADADAGPKGCLARHVLLPTCETGSHAASALETLYTAYTADSPRRPCAAATACSTHKPLPCPAHPTAWPPGRRGCWAAGYRPHVPPLGSAPADAG